MSAPSRELARSASRKSRWAAPLDRPGFGRVPKFARCTSQLACNRHQSPHGEVLSPLFHPLNVLKGNTENLCKLRLRPSFVRSQLRDSSPDVGDNQFCVRCSHRKRGSRIPRGMKNISYDVHRVGFSENLRRRACDFKIDRMEFVAASEEPMRTDLFVLLTVVTPLFTVASLGACDAHVTVPGVGAASPGTSAPHTTSAPSAPDPTAKAQQDNARDTRERNAGYAQQQAVQKEYDRGHAQYMKDAARLKSTCDDIAELEKLAGTASTAPSPYANTSGQKNAVSISELYKNEAKRRHDAEVAAFQGALRRFGEDDKKWREELPATDPLPPLPSSGSLRAAIDAFRCFNPDVAAKTSKFIDETQAHNQGLLDQEAKCRVTPACVGPRIAAPICGMIAQRRGALQDINTERANPGGVVDKKLLHDLGETVQDLDKQIASEKARYGKIVGKAFSDALCAK